MCARERPVPGVSEREFICWFGNSITVDEGGTPVLLYHGSTDPWFVPYLRYGMGPHFGNWETARKRIEQRAFDYPDRDEHVPKNGDSIIPAYLRIERPAFMRDVHFDELKEFVSGILESEALSRADIEAVCGNQNNWYALPDQEDTQTMARIVQLLIERGYDGIAYRNVIEGNGTLSWVPFTLGQIWIVPVDLSYGENPR